MGELKKYVGNCTASISFSSLATPVSHLEGSYITFSKLYINIDFFLSRYLNIIIIASSKISYSIEHYIKLELSYCDCNLIY